MINRHPLKLLESLEIHADELAKKYGSILGRHRDGTRIPMPQARLYKPGAAMVWVFRTWEKASDFRAALINDMRVPKSKTWITSDDGSMVDREMVPDSTRVVVDTYYLGKYGRYSDF